MEETPFPIKIIFPENGDTKQFQTTKAEWLGDIVLPGKSETAIEIPVIYGSKICKKPEAKNAMLPEWNQYAEQIPTVNFRNESERSAYYKAWSILYFNEVKRNNKQWVMTGTGFGSMWIWDTSPFIINAYLKIKADWAREMVKQQLLSIRSDGFMPLHALTAEYIDSEPPNSITQIPLVPDSVLTLFLQNNDKEFIEWTYPLLVKHYGWFERRRKPLEELPLWIVDDYRKPYFSGAESGMDNSPIYQGRPIYSVAQNAAKVSFEHAMHKLALTLSKPDDALIWLKRKEATVEAIESRMWSEKEGFYFPLTLELEQIGIKTSDVFPALFFDFCKPLRIKQVIQCLQDEFLTEYGLTTVSRNEKVYISGNYFQGAVWPCMNYLAYRGMKIHGFNDLAEKILQGTVKTTISFPSIYECYDAERKTTGYYNGPVLPFMSFCAASLINMFLER
ncbi:MAG: hypothetical protein JNL74_17605 [Fibrobacteres bacterium]|nr:hypothetical protein [Fibrobacterota bacterium]